MKSLRRFFKERSLRRCIIYFLTFSLILNTTLPGVMALEVTDVISSTGAVPTQWGDHTIIDTQHGAIIDWSNFDTSSTQSVTFNQYMDAVQNSASAVLNRISSGSVPTMFNGVLNANGRVFIVNPAGVIFGAGSSINVSQLVASGLDMSNGAFKDVLANEGNPMVFKGGAGQVENYGFINANSVQLVGKKIINMGTIAAPGGLVVMATGDNIYLAQNGSNVLVELNEGSTRSADSIINEGSVEVGNGKFVLAAGDSFSSAIITEGDNIAASSSTDSKDIGKDEDSDSDDSSQIALSCYTEPEPKREPKSCPDKDKDKYKDDRNDKDGHNGCGDHDGGDNGGGDNGGGDNGGGDNGGGDNGGGDNGGGDNGGGDNGGGDNGGGDNGGGDNGGGDNGGGDNGGGNNSGGDNGSGDNGSGDNGIIHGSVAVFMTSAPVPEIELEYAGCPALMKWAADELGIDERMMQIWTSSAMASNQDIQPCNSCARLKAMATILRDADGTHTAALSQVISEYASRTAPPSPEEMTMIASAISDSGNSDNQYAKAREYLDALSAYVSTLNGQMNFSVEESVLFAADRYVAPLAKESQNDGMVAFLATRLASMAGSGS